MAHSLLVPLVGLLLVNGALSQLPFTCNFESDLCNMIQDTTDSPSRTGGQTYDWTRRSGSTPTANTGPSSGQGGSGNYIFIETSDPVRSGDTANIMTNDLGFTGDVCISFYYHMYGANVQRLRMFVQTGSNTGARNYPFSESGDKGNVWLQSEQTVRLNSNQDRVGFSGERGNDYQGDIGVDSISITRGACGSGGEVGTTVNLPFNCDFESDTICGMTQSSSDSFDWTRSSTGTPTGDTGPDRSQSGSFFMYIETSDPRRPNEQAILETPSISNGGSACLRFFAHMYGQDVGSLSVRTTSSGSTNVYTDSGNKGNAWNQVSVDLNLNTNDKVIFVGQRGQNIRGDIAIDNVQISSGGCSGTPSQGNLPYSCSFESDFCGMENWANNRDEFDWERQNGPTGTSETGPSGGSEGTFYMYAETSAPRVPNDRAYITTPSLVYSNRDICVQFDYHMYGVNMGQLVVYVESRGENSPLLSETGNKGNNWQNALLDASINNNDKIVFKAVRGSDIRGDIAVDNLRITGGSCSGSPGTTQGPDTGESITDLFTCDLEGDGSSNGNCRIRQSTSDNFNWVRRTGRTPTGLNFNRKINDVNYPVTGPQNAQQGSYYLYIEASGRRDGEVARIVLEGSDTTGGGNKCLRFFYCMNGFHAGTLSVYQRTGSNNRVTTWSLSGDKQVSWFPAAVDLDMNNVNEIGLQASVSGKFSGDISLDNVRMSNGRCESIPSQYIWWCNFETSNDGASTSCNMEQQTQDEFDWTFYSGGTPSEFTGPDRAFNGNYYMYIEASKPRTQGNRARILIPTLGRSGSVCVEFYRHMYGFHTGSLTIFKQRGSTITSPSEWTLSGEQGNNWVEQRVTIQNLQSDEQIGFQGTVGTEYSGDIAVDNIRVRSGQC